MPAKTKTLIEEALARLDAAGQGGSPVACHLQSALCHLDTPGDPAEVAHRLGLAPARAHAG